MLAFIGVVLLLFIIPGPAVLLTLSQTMRGGRGVGVRTGIGIAAGDLIHTLAAVLGLSAILMTSAVAFQFVKYLGAAYLVYLGIRSILEKVHVHGGEGSSHSQNRGVLSFYQVILVEVMNPKTALFFLAFLPQFVHKGGGPIVGQLLTLGLTFVLMSILYTTSLVFLVSAFDGFNFPGKSLFKRYQGKVVGTIFIGLAMKLALQSQK